MHNESWLNRPGRVYPSPGQITSNVVQLENLSLLLTCSHWFNWRGGDIIIDFSLASPPLGDTIFIITMAAYISNESNHPLTCLAGCLATFLTRKAWWGKGLVADDTSMWQLGYIMPVALTEWPDIKFARYF